MSDRPFQILLVEDNAADIYLLRKALQNAALDFELIEIEDGAEALAFVRGEGKYAGRVTPDLAVVDLNLPKNDGVEVLSALRKSKGLSNVPVVIVTSSTSRTERERAEQFRIEQYITKPADLSAFLQIGLVLKNMLLANAAG